MTAACSREDYGSQARPLLLYYIYLVLPAAGNCRRDEWLRRVLRLPEGKGCQSIGIWRSIRGLACRFGGTIKDINGAVREMGAG